MCSKKLSSINSQKLSAYVKNELARKAENTGEVKLTKNMPIVDMIKALEPEIARALPSVITPERFTRMAVTDLK